MHSTPNSLLIRLCDAPRRSGGPIDQRAWERFVDLYSPLIYRYARRLEAQEADAFDLMQEVFLHLHQKLPEFRYDQQLSFRNWLRTVLYNKWRDRQRGRTPARAVDPQLLDDLATPGPGQTLVEDDYRRYLVHRAMELMKTDFEPTTWQAFWETTVHSRPAAEVASQLNLSVAAVYKAASRVRHGLREELSGLLE
jgi:RNA polymerase sigma-70 factor (ECF subfamily)